MLMHSLIHAIVSQKAANMPFNFVHQMILPNRTDCHTLSGAMHESFVGVVSVFLTPFLDISLYIVPPTIPNILIGNFKSSQVLIIILPPDRTSSAIVFPSVLSWVLLFLPVAWRATKPCFSTQEVSRHLMFIQKIFMAEFVCSQATANYCFIDE